MRFEVIYPPDSDILLADFGLLNSWLSPYQLCSALVYFQHSPDSCLPTSPTFSTYSMTKNSRLTGRDSLPTLEELSALTTSVTLLPKLIFELPPLPKHLTPFDFCSILGKDVFELEDIFEALFPFALSLSGRLVETCVFIFLDADAPSCVSISIPSGKSVTLAKYCLVGWRTDSGMM